MKHECIVGIDGSDVAIDALRWAVRNTDPQVHDVVAATVWHVPLAIKATLAKRSLDVDRLGLEAEADHHLTTAIDALGDEATTVVRRVVEGHASSALVDAASDAALLVVGRRGISELKHRIFGSVSQYCATHAAVPIVVVPPEFDGPRVREVVVGFDGSEHSREALGWALDFFDDDCRIRAEAAIDLSPWLDVESTRDRFPEDVQNEEQRLTDALDAVDPDRRAERHIQLHGARQVLAEASGTADIVVLGARGHGAIGAAMLGSVSTWMLHRAVCPVAIVPTTH